ncbi:MAG: phosphate permease [Candidatus Hydrothermota bacterium]|nr:MAG: phosphate permease [Candidatus Hydrothermae bacterium]
MKMVNLILTHPLLILTFAVGMFMAWGIGANDTANSMSTAVGAGAITPRQAVVIAAVLEFVGAYYFGKHVTETIRKGIIDPNQIGDLNALIYGSLAPLLSAAIWLLAASYWGLPVSTTHSIVGGLVGYGIAHAGLGAVRWGKMGLVVLSWVLSPFVGGLVGFTLFWMIRKTILGSDDPLASARRFAPLWIGLAFFIVGMMFYLKTMHGKVIAHAILMGGVAGVAASLISALVLRNYGGEANPYKSVERIFRNVQVVTSCYVALSHGANDVANAIGPVAAVYSAIVSGTAGLNVPVPKWILALGGIGIALGVATWGYRVMQTVGHKITHLTNTRGFSIDFATATTVLVASRMGMPISTTHTVVGAVVGVGLAREIKAINTHVLKDIVISWFVTVPAAAVMSAFIFKILQMTLGG